MMAFVAEHCMKTVKSWWLINCVFKYSKGWKLPMSCTNWLLEVARCQENVLYCLRWISHISNNCSLLEPERQL